MSNNLHRFSRFLIGSVFILSTISCGHNDYLTSYSKGVAQYSEKDFENSLVSLSKAIELNPQCAICFYQRAKVWEEFKDTFEALEDYDSAILIESEQPRFYYSRGRLRMLQALDRKWAIEDFTKAIELDPKNAGIYYESRAIAYELNQQEDKAIADRNKAKELK
jgi:tetratricopeptide (TPR) repeat protein